MYHELDDLGGKARLVVVTIEINGRWNPGATRFEVNILRRSAQLV